MHRSILMLAIAAILGPAVWTGCLAEKTLKQGVEGEFCNNRDDDCREGHICQEGICRALQSAGEFSCADMCNRLEECNTGEENCEADCQATIRGTCQDRPCPWSTDAVDAFGQCIVEDLTCEEARQTEAPQECYRRIPIADDRQGRCEAFIAAADRCNPGVDTTELRNRCFLLGRTGTDESWERTDPCVERISGGLCNEIEVCYNSVFELSPPIELGDDSIGESDLPTNNGANDDDFDGEDIPG